MNLDHFVVKFANLFEDTDPSEITAETEFQKLDEWDSLAALSVIALAKTAYSKDINGGEVRACAMVKDVYNLIASK